MLISADTVAQRRYAAATKTPRTGLAIGPTVVRGLRDIGFRDSAAALAALIDNGIDGGARRIDVVIEGSRGMPNAIAVIDNGYGMVPEMIRAACAVGVSCLLGDGHHLARNGFGLPSAPFSISTCFDVLSCPRGEPLYGVTMDLAEIASDKVPASCRAALPMFLSTYVATHIPAWAGGTAVVIRDLDRTSPGSVVRLRADLFARLGYIFAHFLEAIDLRIDGERVAPVAPLLRSVNRAGGTSAVEGNPELQTVAVAGAQLTVAVALLAHEPKSNASRAPSENDRSAAGDRSRGFVISRLGRRLAVTADNPMFTFGAADWRLRAEIDFPPALDHLFMPALNLQQVHIADPVWCALRAAGVGQKLESLRRRCRLERTRGQAPDAPAALASTASPRRRNRCPN